jgi:hypothetical protein
VELTLLALRPTAEEDREDATDADGVRRRAAVSRTADCWERAVMVVPPVTREVTVLRDSARRWVRDEVGVAPA